MFSRVCCLVLFSFFNFNPFLSLERTFAKPLYFIKSHLPKSENSQIQIKPSDKYTMVLVGDSMTDYLGSGDEIKKNLKKYYPSKEIEIKNFSIGSTNILTLPDRLDKVTNYNGAISQPILLTKFDLIIIESFGNNPLSQYSLEDGLKKHSEILDKVQLMIKQAEPQALVVFMATIAPSHDRYAEGVANLTSDERRKWAEERASYIKNHINYAKSHNTPIINIYEKSLDGSGWGNIDFIDSHDFIHPSPTGINFINKGIAEFIFRNRIFPL